MTNQSINQSINQSEGVSKTVVGIADGNFFGSPCYPHTAGSRNFHIYYGADTANRWVVIYKDGKITQRDDR
jgi:hypothetical protein